MTPRGGPPANGNGNGYVDGTIPVDWERLARATAHPLRVSVLEILGLDGGRTLSPNDLSQELQIPLSNTNYHVTELAKAGLIDLARERQVRGATEHFYCLPKHARNGTGKREKRTTGFEPATSSLGSSRSTN
jgi:DNA-binding transcriptional ArsR family regulator